MTSGVKVTGRKKLTWSSNIAFGSVHWGPYIAFWGLQVDNRINKHGGVILRFPQVALVLVRHGT